MGEQTGIQWTDSTWNPIRGCSRVSEGCRNCYAEGVAYRFSGPGQAYEGLVRIGADGERRREWNGQVRFVEKHLLDPLRWTKPRKIFVNSMSDLFHDGVTDEQLDRIFAVMALCPQHTFQVLTKRPERMLSYLGGQGRQDNVASRGGAFDVESAIPLEKYADRQSFLGSDGGFRSLFSRWPLPNVWLGVSVEDQKTADTRVPMLLDTPATVRFISAEPLLGAVDLNKRELICKTWRRGLTIGRYLDWVICGGESGGGSRPMHPDWVRQLRDQCAADLVPFFFKQWGAWLPWEPDGGFCEWKSQSGKLMDRHGFPDFKDSGVRDWTDELLYEGHAMATHQRVGKKLAGDLLDGRQWHQFPAVGA